MIFSVRMPLTILCLYHVHIIPTITKLLNMISMKSWLNYVILIKLY